MGNTTSLKRHMETAERTGVFQLSRSNLHEIPKDLQPFCHMLRNVDLSFNKIQHVSDCIGSFKNLKILNLSNNKLKSLSANISQLTKLETLLLSNNLLSELPDEIVKLDNLKRLNLASNKFTTYPATICLLKALDVIDLSQNEIKQIPDAIRHSQASEINLNNNRLEYLNDALKDCSKLKILRLDNNRVSLDSITPGILRDSKICLLSFENNGFTEKALQGREGYEEYSERYTATKRKLI